MDGWFVYRDHNYVSKQYYHFLDNIGPALAVALLTPFYGYFIKILTNVIVNRMDYNKLIEELREKIRVLNISDHFL